MPELCQRDEERERCKEARLDVIAYWPGESTQYRLDVTTTCPLREGNEATWRKSGAAASTAEGVKERRYGLEVHPIAIETYGRLGPRSPPGRLAAHDVSVNVLNS